MGEFLGGTTIGGYPALHSGMKEINLTGNIRIDRPTTEASITLVGQNSGDYWPDIKMYSNSIQSGIIAYQTLRIETELNIDIYAQDALNLTSLQSVTIAGLDVLLNSPSVVAQGDIKWNNGADSLDALKSSVSSGKTTIASAITAKGVTASGSDTHAQLATKVGQIVGGSVGTIIPKSNYLDKHDLTSVSGPTPITFTLNTVSIMFKYYKIRRSFINATLMADFQVGNPTNQARFVSTTTGTQLSIQNYGSYNMMHHGVSKDYTYVFTTDYYLKIYNNTGSLISNVYPTSYIAMGTGYLMDMSVDYYSNTCYLMFFKQINGVPDGSATYIVKFKDSNFERQLPINLNSELVANGVIGSGNIFPIDSNTCIINASTVNTWTYQTLALSSTLTIKWKSNVYLDDTHYSKVLSDDTFFIISSNSIKRHKASDYSLVESVTKNLGSTEYNMYWDGRYVVFIRRGYDSAQTYPLFLYDPWTPLVAKNIVEQSATSDINSFVTKNTNQIIDANPIGNITDGTEDFLLVDSTAYSSGGWNFRRMNRNRVSSGIIIT